MTATAASASRRYHGLDALRGFAMLMGIALHAALPYFSRMIGFEAYWPADDDQSVLLIVVFDFIHTWRMPVFFILAGFFAHLVLDRRPISTFVVDRLRRIGVPLVVFGAVMALILPPLWVYGWKGTLSIEGLWAVMATRQDFGSSGDLVGHLWFLYYLLLMYAALLVGRHLTRLLGALGLRVLPDWGSLLGRYLANAICTRVPVVLALAAVVLVVIRGGDESKPFWPLNLSDVLYSALFFFYGYLLHARRGLIDKFSGPGTLISLWAIATVTYLLHLVAIGTMDEVTKLGGDRETLEVLGLVNAVVYGISVALFSTGLIGLFERFLRSPRHWVRWLADSSYWIYIMHLPVVAFLTFWLAHMDRQGWLERFTGLGWSAEAKFLVACLGTGLLGLATYQYLVRYTPIGTLLNGKRIRPSP